MELRYTIPLAPVTKKNHQQIMYNAKTGRRFVKPSPQYEQYAEAALNSILAGKTADVVMCIQPCFYDAPLHKGLLYNLDDGTMLQIRPILNEVGEPELLIRCVTKG